MERPYGGVTPLTVDDLPERRSVPQNGHATSAARLKAEYPQYR
jgi:hypothetical protein